MRGRINWTLEQDFIHRPIAGNLVWMEPTCEWSSGRWRTKSKWCYRSGHLRLVPIPVYGQAVTDSDGSGFTNWVCCLKTDLYYKFTPPAGLNATYANMGSDNINSNDVDHSNGLNTTRVFSMQSGYIMKTLTLVSCLWRTSVTWVSVNGKSERRAQNHIGKPVMK